MAGITFSESEIKDLIFALARSKGEGMDEDEAMEMADEAKKSTRASEKKDDDGAGEPHGEKKSTADLMAEKMKEKEKNARR